MYALSGCDNFDIVRIGTIAHRKLSQRRTQIHRVQHQNVVLAKRLTI